MSTRHLWLFDGLVHFVTYEKLDGTPDGIDIYRYYFGCGRRLDYQVDAGHQDAPLTCIPCLALSLARYQTIVFDWRVEY